MMPRSSIASAHSRSFSVTGTSFGPSSQSFSTAVITTVAASAFSRPKNSRTLTVLKP